MSVFIYLLARMQISIFSISLGFESPLFLFSHLFAWLDELLYSDHPIFIPVHFLKEKKWQPKIYSLKKYCTELILYIIFFYRIYLCGVIILFNVENKDCWVWPGRSSPHVLLEHRPAYWGMCTSPSCHRWTSWCPTSPGKWMTKGRTFYYRM